MLRARRRSFFRPPLIPPIAMGTAALISLAAAQLTAAAPFFRSTSATADCSSQAGAARAASRHAAPPPQVAERLDALGEFTGRDISFSASGRSYALSLPVESSVSERQGDALVYTTSLSGHSEVHMVDLASGCDALLARMAGTARSAILSRGADAVYVHSLVFPSRFDAGVTRYALGGTAQQVLAPLPDDARFGLTFGTQLGWSQDGKTLFAQSCAAQACRTRLLELATGSVALLDGDGQGAVIGLTQSHLVTYAACSGLPCAVISVDRSSGAVATLTAEAWNATMAGNTVEIETAAGKIEVDE